MIQEMSTTTDLLADIDRMDAKAFASYLAEDCVLRYANADEVVGRAAIEEAIAGFFSTIKGISHNVVGQWDVDDTTIIQFEATYTRMDDRRVTVPAVTIYRRGVDLIDDYRVYVDLAPVYA
jgi:ketosteroid isomerase-like protein